ncbi:MAG: hypothetical protein OIF32_11305 [Campylobacterales bacterium]|nr:hypothetical protein [Campylobacterales bacterium]
MKYFKYMIFISLFFYSGCTGEMSEKGVEVPLENGVSYRVYDGDEVIKLTDPTDINISHRLSDNAKFVVVNSGSAKLLRGEYFLGENR